MNAYRLSLAISGHSTNCITYSNTQTGKKARIATCSRIAVSSPPLFTCKGCIIELTSKQYPNSNCSPSPSLVNRPCCLLHPGNPAIPGPSSLPTRKNAAVATSNETARKCTKTKRRVRRTAAPTELVYAIPQAIPVRSMKKERR